MQGLPYLALNSPVLIYTPKCYQRKFRQCSCPRNNTVTKRWVRSVQSPVHWQFSPPKRPLLFSGGTPLGSRSRLGRGECEVCGECWEVRKRTEGPSHCTPRGPSFHFSFLPPPFSCRLPTERVSAEERALALSYCASHKLGRFIGLRHFRHPAQDGVESRCPSPLKILCLSTRRTRTLTGPNFFFNMRSIHF